MVTFYGRSAVFAGNILHNVLNAESIHIPGGERRAPAWYMTIIAP
ncbi:hypothetical protein X956_04840 [Trueperella pyogenes TP8]|nr:hypothetical protein X956_04840 [Trueperella pyogenes TP8]